MVAGAHNGLDVKMDIVVNASCPQCCCEQEQLMGEEVHGQQEEEEAVRGCLDDAISRIERQTW